MRAIVVGGAEGGALPPSLLDTPYDFDPLEEAGAIVGSSILELLPVNTCMVAWSMERTRYLSKETCGKCVPCRLGVKRMAGLLEGIISDLGVNGDLDVLDEFAAYVPNGSSMWLWCAGTQSVQDSKALLVRTFYVACAGAAMSNGHLYTRTFTSFCNQACLAVVEFRSS